MADFQVRCTVDGHEDISAPMSEAEARASAVSHDGFSIVDALEDDGYMIRYIQMVLDGPDGHEAVIDVEPA